jgi:hypothetical protein
MAYLPPPLSPAGRNAAGTSRPLGKGARAQVARAASTSPVLLLRRTVPEGETVPGVGFPCCVAPAAGGAADDAEELEVTPGRWRVQVAAEPDDHPEQVEDVRRTAVVSPWQAWIR